MTTQPEEEHDPHGPGGMDAIDDEPVRAPEDDDAPGGMTGIPDLEEEREERDAGGARE